MSEGRVSECTHTPRKKKSHTSACVYISAACTRQHTKTYDHRTHTPEQNVPTHTKKKCTLQHQYALLMVVVVAVSACTRRHNKYTHQHSTHIRTSGMHAPVAKQNKTKHQHQYKQNTLTSTALTPEQTKKEKNTHHAHTHKCALQHQSVYTRLVVVCVCMFAQHARTSTKTKHQHQYKQNTLTSTALRTNKKIEKKNAHSSTSMHAPRVCVCVCACLSVCLRSMHTPAQKNTLTAPHSHTRKKMHSSQKKMYTPAPVCTHVVVLCVRACARVCIYLRHARTSSETKHQHRTHIPDKKGKCALQQQYARTWCVRACMSAA